MLPSFFLLKYQEERAEVRDTPAESLWWRDSKGDLGQGSKGSLELGFKRSWVPPLRSMVLWKPWGQSLRLTVKRHSFVSSPGPRSWCQAWDGNNHRLVLEGGNWRENENSSLIYMEMSLNKWKFQTVFSLRHSRLRVSMAQVSSV